MATEAAGTSALRLPTPDPRGYDAGPMEQAIVGRVAPFPMMADAYPYLLGARTDAANAQERYRGDLNRVTALQSALAQQKLQQDLLENDRSTALGLIDKGGIPATAALAALQLRGLPTSVSPQDASTLVRGSDQRNADFLRARTALASGQAMQAGVEAGVNPDPGQSTSLFDPEALRRLRSTTGNPLDVRTAEIGAAAQRDRSTNKGPKIASVWDEASQTWKTTVTSDDPEEVAKLSRRHRAAVNGPEDERITAAGGNAQSGNRQGAGVANAGASGRPGNLLTGPLTDRNAALAGVQAWAQANKATIGDVVNMQYVNGVWQVTGTRTGGQPIPVPLNSR